jgi:hypothetical protein
MSAGAGAAAHESVPLMSLTQRHNGGSPTIVDDSVMIDNQNILILDIPDGGRETEKPTVSTPSRTIYVDWMRGVAIYLVVVVHINVSIPRVLDVETWQQNKLNSVFRILLQFGMPIFVI